MNLTYRQLSIVEMLLYVEGMTVTRRSQYFDVSRKGVYDALANIALWLQ